MKKVPSLTLFTKGNFIRTPPTNQYSWIHHNPAPCSHYPSNISQSSFYLNPHSSNSKAQKIKQILIKDKNKNLNLPCKENEQNKCQVTNKKAPINSLITDVNASKKYSTILTCESSNCILKNLTSFLLTRNKQINNGCQCLSQFRKQTNNQNNFICQKTIKVFEPQLSICKETNICNFQQNFKEQKQDRFSSKNINQQILNSNFTFNNCSSIHKNNFSRTDVPIVQEDKRQDSFNQHVSFQNNRDKVNQTIESIGDSILLSEKNQGVNKIKKNNCQVSTQYSCVNISQTCTENKLNLLKAQNISKLNNLDQKIILLFQNLQNVGKINENQQQIEESFSSLELFNKLVQYQQDTKQCLKNQFNKINLIVNNLEPVCFLNQNIIKKTQRIQNKKQRKIQTSEQSIQINFKENEKVERVEIDSHLNSNSIRIAKKSTECIPIFGFKKKGRQAL